MGGKSGPLPQLLAHFPARFKRYFEPFMGGAAVFLALEPGREAWLSDSNPELVQLYQTVRNQPFELMEALDLLRTHYSEEFYYSLRSRPQTD
ncbi:DNA adenine methylase, partial [bacterium]|nr:DNA adenine methylase [bacterium]